MTVSGLGFALASATYTTALAIPPFAPTIRSSSKCGLSPQTSLSLVMSTGLGLGGVPSYLTVPVIHPLAAASTLRMPKHRTAAPIIAIIAKGLVLFIRFLMRSAIALARILVRRKAAPL